MAGVFVTKGMTWGIPPGGLVISRDSAGKPVGGPMTIHVHFDVGPTWLEIALRHLEDAKVKRAVRIEAWQGTDEQAKAAALEGEFEASMQAITAAVTAIDAFYAVVRTKTQLPHDLIAAWRKNRTARDAQVSELLRRAFSLNSNDTHTRVLRQNLRELYRIRGQAVHPTGKIEAPVLHPELGVGVEWRFAEFRFENAYLAVRETVSMLCQLVTYGKPQNAQIQKYADTMRPRLQELQKAKALAPDPSPKHPTE
jgi:hypothetical protein